MTFAVDVVFCVPTLEAGSTAGHVLRKPVAQWNSLQQASTLKVGESPSNNRYQIASELLTVLVCHTRHTVVCRSLLQAYEQANRRFPCLKFLHAT